jgi:hypothetical protein
VREKFSKEYTIIKLDTFKIQRNRSKVHNSAYIYKRQIIIRTEYHSLPVEIKILFQRIKGVGLDKPFQNPSKLFDII